MEEASSQRPSAPGAVAVYAPALLPPKHQSPAHPQAPAEPSPVFIRSSGNFKPSANDSIGRSVLLERDRNQAVAVSALWHGSSSKFSSAIADRFYKDNSLDKARKLKDAPLEAKVEKSRLSRLTRIQQQKEELDSIRNRQKTMKSRIKQFIEERLELEQKFEASAVVIQKHIRGFLARKRVMQWMYEREKERLGELLGMMQKQINCFWTGTGEQANSCATKIQALYRGFRVRVSNKREKQALIEQELTTRSRTAAAVLIQRSYRAYRSAQGSRSAALDAIRKRLLVLKLKSFWHRKKLVWACMRKKYKVDPPPVQLTLSVPVPPRRPSSAKRTGGGFVTDANSTKSRGLSIESKLELTTGGLQLPPTLSGNESVASKQGQTKAVPAPKPQAEVKRPTVPLIPRPRDRPPRAPRAEEDLRVSQIATGTTAGQQEQKRAISRSYSDSPPKYLQPTTSFKYRTGVDASIDMPSKGRKRHRKFHDSTLNRPTISRQQYVQESNEKRARSADPRERNWKPTVGVTADMKALPAVERVPPKLPSYLLSEEEEDQLVVSQRIVESEREAEKVGSLGLGVEKEYVYRPPAKQSLDFKEALPEYHDFLLKYGKNLKPESTPRPDTNRSSASFRSDSLRITPRVSAKKVEL